MKIKNNETLSFSSLLIFCLLAFAVTSNVASACLENAGARCDLACNSEEIRTSDLECVSSGGYCCSPAPTPQVPPQVPQQDPNAPGSGTPSNNHCSGTCRGANSGCLLGEGNSGQMDCDNAEYCCTSTGTGGTGMGTGGGGGGTGGLPGTGPSTSGTGNSGSGQGIYIPTDTGLPDPPGGVQGVLRSLLTWLLGIIGILALGGFVISGIQYILASGDEDMMQTAKRNMLYSIIGITVALASFVIIQAISFALQGSSIF